MKTIKVYQVNSFSSGAFGGNPAGVVSKARGLTETELVKIARELNHPETAFIFPPTKPEADYLIRFFTPSGDEVELCGHATVAAFYVLAHEGRLKLSNGDNFFRQQTAAGILEVKLVCVDGRVESIIMSQNLPKLVETVEDCKRVAAILNIKQIDLNLYGLPMQIVSTGMSDLMVPVASLEILKNMKPDFRAMAAFQKEKGFVSIHAFSLETEQKGFNVHTRDFAPSVDVDEEAATGLANGALASYLVKHEVVDTSSETVFLKVEQGWEMGRPSEIHVEVKHELGAIIGVKAGGTAVIFLQGQIHI